MNLNFYFFYRDISILKIRCIHEASSVRKLKSSNMIPQRKKFVKLVRKQYRNPDFPIFFYVYENTFFEKINWGFNRAMVSSIIRKILVYGILWQKHIQNS